MPSVLHNDATFSYFTLPWYPCRHCLANRQGGVKRLLCQGVPSAIVTVAKITTTLGDISFQLLPDIAPETVRNFVKLAGSGFYNGTLFHRVIPGFMIQGGDPNTKAPNKERWGSGGPGYTIKAEFNNRSHMRGIVSMARSTDPDSAGSQFFIVTSDSTFLDRQYTVFGQVESGMDVADLIVNLKRDSKDCPHEPPKILGISLSE